MVSPRLWDAGAECGQGASPPHQAAVGTPRPALPHSQGVWVHSQLCPTGRAHQRKLVGDLAIRRDFGTKAVGREELVTVVVLDDFPHCLQCQGIGAQLVGARVVQRGGL